MRNEELRRCIADAYDKHVGTSTEENIMEDAVAKVIAERKEARARLVLDFLDANWHEPEPGETQVWSVEFDGTPGKTYHYSAVLGEDHRWYVTRDSGHYTTEALKAYIADICLRAEVYFNGELVA